MFVERPLVSDNFNRADVSPIGAPWVTITGVPDLQIVSNHIEGTLLNNRGGAYYDTTFAQNHFAIVNVLAGVANFLVGPAVRIQASVESYYFASIEGIGADSPIRIGKYIAGSLTTLASTTTTTASTDNVKLLSFSSSHTMSKDGTFLLSVTDSDLQDGRAGVILQVDPIATADTQIDNFSAGNVEFLPESTNYKWPMIMSG